MGLFKKLGSFLFEENEEEVIVDDALERVNFSNIKEDDVDEIMQQRRVEKNAAVLRPEPIEEEEEVSRIETIDLIKPIEISEEKPEKKEEVRRSRSAAANDQKKEYVFEAVISPMFGSSEKKQKPKPKTEVKVSQKTNKKNNILGTVISPMYGENELELFERRAQQDLQQIKEEESRIVEIIEDETENVALSDLVMNVEPKSEECVQFSLFGDDRNVNDIEIEDAKHRLERDE